MIEGARVIESTRDHAIGALRDVVLLVWRRDTSLAGTQAFDRAAHDLARALGTRVGLLTVVEAEAPIPSSAAREALSSAMKSCSDVLIASAVTFEGEGFRASAVRGVATALSLMAKPPYPHKTFATVHDAAQWLSSRMHGAQLPPDILESAVAQLRAASVASGPVSFVRDSRV
jgi:hypothetical protein